LVNKRISAIESISSREKGPLNTQKLDSAKMLGAGKDGQTYYHSGCIFKKLSGFGKLYHPVTLYLWNYLQSAFMPRQFVALQLYDSGYFYFGTPFIKIKIDELPTYICS